MMHAALLFHSNHHFLQEMYYRPLYLLIQYVEKSCIHICLYPPVSHVKSLMNV